MGATLPFGLDDDTPRRALLACGLVAALSLALPSALGYDPWAWLVWGRQLASLHLDTTGGPSWKPLPPLLTAPFTIDDALAPAAWVMIVRTAAFAAVLFAFRIAYRTTASLPAGLLAALGVVVSTDFFVTALRAYSEPLLIALVLAAFDQHIHGRRRLALWALALASLLRPEVWPFAIAYGLALSYGRDGTMPARLRLAITGFLAPALWLMLDLLGSGNALEAGHVARTSPLGSAAKSAHPALTVLGHARDAVIAPVLVLAVIGLAAGVRRRDRIVMAMGGMAVAWIAIVAVMAQAGFTGRRRYLFVAAALMCVVAASGLQAVLAPAAGRLRAVASVLLAVVVAAFCFSPLRTDHRLVSLAGRQRDQLDELRTAARSSRARQDTTTAVVVNPFVQTALAWELHRRLAGVHATWSSTRSHPGWRPPAYVFTAPAKLAGNRPAIPAGIRLRLIAQAGRWRVFSAAARRTHGPR